MWVKVTFLLLIVALLLGWYALRYLPVFDVQQVYVTTDDPAIAIPASTLRITAPLKGLSQFEISLSKLEQQLEALPMVASAQVHRNMPSSLNVQLQMLQPRALIRSMDADGNQVGYFLLKNDELVPLTQEDRNLYGTTKFTIEVDEAYASLLQRYGVDAGLQAVLDLVAGMGSATDAENALITRIKYDNNNSNEFGRMVVDLPACNARLWVREPVPASLVSRSVTLIMEQVATDELLFLEQTPRRYDLYADALVRR